ncbi:MAG: alpha/beta fold hydrolase [Alphaproteobacteria bacterium]
MPKIRRAFVDSDYGQMHYRTAGTVSDKRTLVCLHQSPKSSREFIEFMKIASNDRLVIAIDSPGHGESDVPSKQASLEDYARSVLCALKNLDLEKVDVVGNHTGAKVATEMAFQAPEAIGHIIMISALVLSDEEREAFIAQFQPIPLDEVGTRFSHMWTQAVRCRGPGVTLEQLAFSVAENTRAGEAYEWGHEAAFRYTKVFPERIATLPHRITVLNPNDLLYEFTPRVAPFLQNGKIVDLPHLGFGFLDTNPKAAVNAVKSGLD